MPLQPDDIVLLAVKRTVIAFNKRSGARLWSQTLTTGLSEDFVTVLADTQRVYAHTKGQFFCLDLFTGNELWRDGLTGLGYGVASIALPGGAATAIPGAAQTLRSNAAAMTAATTAGS